MVPNSWPRLIGLQPKATEMSTEEFRQLKWHNRQRSKIMSAATVIRSTRIIGDPEATLRPSASLEPQTIALETEHLSRSVVGRILVSDISVHVQPGEVLAVVGPSGAGKSSFLRLLNRLDEPTGGPVRLNGQD